MYRSLGVIAVAALTILAAYTSASGSPGQRRPAGRTSTQIVAWTAKEDTSAVPDTPGDGERMPGLQAQPRSEERPLPIPTRWPGFAIALIPTQWPDARVVDVAPESGARAASRGTP